MKKLIGACLGLSLVIGAAGITFAQQQQDPQKQGGKSAGDKGKGTDGSKGKDTTNKK